MKTLQTCWKHSLSWKLYCANVIMETLLWKRYYGNLADLFEAFFIVLVAFSVPCRLILCLLSSALLENICSKTFARKPFAQKF